MKIERILIGAFLLLAINPQVILAGWDDAPEGMKKYKKVYEKNPTAVENLKQQNSNKLDVKNTKHLRSTYSICETPIIMSGNIIDRKTMCYMGAVYNAGKLVIKQTKNPCFFMDKEQWKAYGGKKVNNNTVSFSASKGKENLPTYFRAEQRPDLGYNLRFKKDGSILSTNDIWKNGKIVRKEDGFEVIQVLGKSKQCYLKDTIEEWTLYSKKYGQGRTVKGKIKFYLNSGKLESKKVKEVTETTPQIPLIKEKTEKQKPKIRIYKYGAPYSYGRSFTSMSDCEAERDKLTKSHVGLDYLYKCE